MKPRRYPRRRDLSLLEEPVLEPPVEARDEAAASGEAASDTDAGGFPETILLEDGADEDFMAAMEEPLTLEQEARRRAFEDLFNSDVPFPLEELRPRSRSPRRSVCRA